MSYVAAGTTQYKNGHFTLHLPIAILIVKVKIITLYLTMNYGG